MNIENQTPQTQTESTPSRDPALEPGTDEYAARKRAEMEPRLAGRAVEVASGLVTMPESVSAPLDQTREKNAAEEQAASEQRKAEARAIAEEINATRPEGIPSSLPTDEEPVSGELTASTVRSYKDGVGGPQN